MTRFLLSLFAALVFAASASASRIEYNLDVRHVFDQTYTLSYTTTAAYSYATVVCERGGGIVFSGRTATVASGVNLVKASFSLDGLTGAECAAELYGADDRLRFRVTDRVAFTVA